MNETCRYRIQHRTRLLYDAPVAASHNELRMSPLTESGQTTLENRLRIRPLSWSYVYRDAFGTHVTAMEAMGEHNSLDIESISTVERFVLDSPYDSVGWAGLTSAEVGDQMCEWLIQTPRTDPGPDLVGLAQELTGSGTPGEVAAQLADHIRSEMTYEKGVTGVHTHAVDAWQDRRGVCQDFVHLTLGAFRAAGIPVRYVSGYLVPDPEATPGQTQEGESHAWVEWWDGRWHPLDPTNAIPVTTNHIVVARGRDYQDVPPVKGVYSGSASSRLEVAISFTRIV